MRKSIIGLAGLILFALAPSYASPQQESLAEAARKAREQKKSQPKAAKVFTNDDLTATRGNISVVGSAAAEAEKPALGAKPEARAGKAGAAEEKPAKEEEKGEAYWRRRFAEARSKLRQTEKELDILQRELNLILRQYYDDPNRALREQYTRSEIDTQRRRIDEKRQEVEQLRHAIADLEDELRISGGDPGWAREP